MSEQQAPAFTDDELKEFDQLTMQMSSHNQVERVSGRLAVRRFEETHGKEKCDAMFKVLQERDAKRKSRR